MNQISFNGTLRVWWRFSQELLRHPLHAIINILLTPILYMVGYGVGIGGLISVMNYHGIEVPYGAFVNSGIIATAASFSGFFRGSYGGFFSMHYEHLYTLISTSPLTLLEVALGHLFWCASVAAIGGGGAALVGISLGFGSFSGLPFAIIGAFFIGWVMAAFGLCCAASFKRISQIEYTVNLLLMPTLFMSGAYFPLEQMPHSLQLLVKSLPLAALIEFSRNSLLGVPLPTLSLLAPLLWIALLTPAALWIVRRRLAR